MEVFPLGGDESEPSITSSLGVETQAPQGSCLLLSIALSQFHPKLCTSGLLRTGPPQVDDGYGNRHWTAKGSCCLVLSGPLVASAWPGPTALARSRSCYLGLVLISRRADGAVRPPRWKDAQGNVPAVLPGQASPVRTGTQMGQPPSSGNLSLKRCGASPAAPGRALSRS